MHLYTDVAAVFDSRAFSTGDAFMSGLHCWLRYIYIYIYTHTHTYIYSYIYIYREREG